MSKTYNYPDKESLNSIDFNKSDTIDKFQSNHNIDVPYQFTACIFMILVLTLTYYNINTDYNYTEYYSVIPYISIKDNKYSALNKKIKLNNVFYNFVLDILNYKEIISQCMQSYNQDKVIRDMINKIIEGIIYVITNFEESVKTNQNLLYRNKYLSSTFLKNIHAKPDSLKYRIVSLSINNETIDVKNMCNVIHNSKPVDKLVYEIALNEHVNAQEVSVEGLEILNNCLDKLRTFMTCIRNGDIYMYMTYNIAPDLNTYITGTEYRNNINIVIDNVFEYMSLYLHSIKTLIQKYYTQENVIAYINIVHTARIEQANSTLYDVLISQLTKNRLYDPNKISVDNKNIPEYNQQIINHINRSYIKSNQSNASLNILKQILRNAYIDSNVMNKYSSLIEYVNVINDVDYTLCVINLCLNFENDVKDLLDQILILLPPLYNLVHCDDPDKLTNELILYVYTHKRVSYKALCENIALSERLPENIKSQIARLLTLAGIEGTFDEQMRAIKKIVDKEPAVKYDIRGSTTFRAKDMGRVVYKMMAKTLQNINIDSYYKNISNINDIENINEHLSKHVEFKKLIYYMTYNAKELKEIHDDLLSIQNIINHIINIHEKLSISLSTDTNKLQENYNNGATTIEHTIYQQIVPLINDFNIAYKSFKEKHDDKFVNKYDIKMIYDILNDSNVELATRIHELKNVNFLNVMFKIYRNSMKNRCNDYKNINVDQIVHNAYVSTLSVEYGNTNIDEYFAKMVGYIDQIKNINQKHIYGCAIIEAMFYEPIRLCDAIRGKKKLNNVLPYIPVNIDRDELSDLCDTNSNMDTGLSIIKACIGKNFPIKETDPARKKTLPLKKNVENKIKTIINAANQSSKYTANQSLHYIQAIIDNYKQTPTDDIYAFVCNYSTFEVEYVDLIQMEQTRNYIASYLFSYIDPLDIEEIKHNAPSDSYYYKLAQVYDNISNSLNHNDVAFTKNHVLNIKVRENNINEILNDVKDEPNIETDEKKVVVPPYVSARLFGANNDAMSIFIKILIIGTICIVIISIILYLRSNYVKESYTNQFMIQSS